MKKKVIKPPIETLREHLQSRNETKIIEFIENCFDEEKIDKIDELNKNLKDEFHGVTSNILL